MSESVPLGGERLALERVISTDLRELTLESDWMARAFAACNHLSANEFRALLFVMLSETSGGRMTAGELRKNMGLSGAAISYLVERMAENGHLRREVDTTDRRKVILRYGDHGMSVAREFFTRLGEHCHDALADLPDEDLHAAHRTFAALVSGMRTYRAELPSTIGPEVTHDRD